MPPGSAHFCHVEKAAEYFLTVLQCSSDISELRIRVLYARILRIRVCQYAHIRTYIRPYISLCYASP